MKKKEKTKEKDEIGGRRKTEKNWMKIREEEMKARDRKELEEKDVWDGVKEGEKDKDVKEGKGGTGRRRSKRILR